MTLQNRARGGSVLVVLQMCLGVVALHAQPAAVPAATCQRTLVKCGPFMSGPTYTTLSLVNGVDANGNKVCKFAERRLLPLETAVGFPARWSICSSCDLESRVVLDTWSDSNLDDYLWHFRPTQPASNAIQSDVIPCQIEEVAIDADAKAETPGGGLSYKAHVLSYVSSTPVETDKIDPQLQIKRGGTLYPVAIATMLSLLFGTACGYWLSRRRRV